MTSPNIPKAVASSVRTPGTYLSVNLLAGTSGAGTSSLRALIMAPKSSSGTITEDTQLVRAIGGPDDASTYLGPGTPGHLAAVQLFRAYGLANVDLVAPAASGGSSATNTVTFAGTVTADMTIRFTIQGYEFDLSWAVGENVTTMAARYVAAVSQYTDYLSITAGNVAGVATNTAKIAGPWGNDIQVYYEILAGAGGTVAISAANLSGGTTEPTFANALSLVSTREYDFILLCVSNADAASSSTTSNPGRAKTHVDTYDSGASAKLQQIVVGLTSTTTSAAQTGAIGRNHGPTEYVLCMNGQSLGPEWAGWEVGRRMATEVDDPAVNRIGDSYEGLVGAHDLVTDTPTDTEIENALNNGVSIITYDAQGNPYITRPITTHSQDASGNPDSRLIDVSGVSGTYAFAKDLRTQLPIEFAGAKISADLAAGEEPLPANVTEVRDIKAFVVSRARLFVSKGILRKDKLDTAISDGSLIVEIDDTDETQVNIVIPEGIVKPLAKMSTVVQRVA